LYFLKGLFKDVLEQARYTGGVMLKMDNICKSFPGVKALDGIHIHVGKGDIHGLVGENGAGKSTLIKVLSGAYTCEAGEVTVDGELIKYLNPALMIEKGIAVIYQELMLLEHGTVAENIFLGRQPRNKFGFIDYKKMRDDASAVLKGLNLDLDPDAVVEKLSVAKRQMVEISKAMSRNAKLIVLDEPTAVLGENELEGLFKLVRDLSRKGITFIYISHRLKEIFDLCDLVTIMKDGKVVESGRVSQYNIDKLVQKMVGREMKDIYPSKANRTPGEEALRVNGFSRAGVFKDVTFSVRKGEIFGIAGLAGAGRTEVLRAIIGADPIDSGELFIKGEAVSFKGPRDAIAKKIGIVPEERKTQGLLLKQDVVFNTSLAAIHKFTKFNLINLKAERKNALDYIKLFQTKPGDPNILVKSMSGGNQQKVVLSKWLTTECEILLVDEPTRGIDVGTKQEIYRILNQLVEKGMTLIMVSSELPEILGMCNRIMIMCEGQVTGIIDADKADEELLMGYATKHIIPQSA
jgi:ribose transport system ATP-binding protein